MACGEEMVLTAVASDTAVTVEGFQHQTLQCPACRTTERRYVFTRGSTETTTPPPVSSCPQEPASSCPQQPASSCPQEPVSSRDIAPAPAWARAVEKLRSRQADLHERADAAKRTNWNIQFDQTWEKLAPPRREPLPAGNSTPGKPKNLAWKSDRALRAQLRKTSPPPSRNKTRQPAIEPTAEAVQQFNQFWDSLVPARNLSRPQAEIPVPSALLAPLPRSLSLVPVEASEAATLEAMSAADRAILLFRGTHHMGRS
jgi:hypothetical protein